ncbi:hypothetical protein MKX01_026999 [Papaver californicum]|nr:hypothetical protein MKX01_026999 [Papaver californicum]
MFSWFPRLIYVSLASSHITGRGLEALARCCSSMETVNLSFCQSITDSGISFLLQNCRKLRTLYIQSCSSITGIGFLECPKTLTHLEAGGCKLTLEGINAIVSGGGLENLCLSTPYVLREVGEGSMNTEAVITISKCCPSLKNLYLSNCVEVEFKDGKLLVEIAKIWHSLTCMGAESYVI